MDYRDLLMRYIALVQVCEGADYVDEAELSTEMKCRVKFSEEEAKELKNLSLEANRYWNPEFFDKSKKSQIRIVQEILRES